MTETRTASDAMRANNHHDDTPSSAAVLAPADDAPATAPNASALKPGLLSSWAQPGTRGQKRAAPTRTTTVRAKRQSVSITLGDISGISFEEPASPPAALTRPQGTTLGGAGRGRSSDSNSSQSSAAAPSVTMHASMGTHMPPATVPSRKAQPRRVAPGRTTSQRTAPPPNEQGVTSGAAVVKPSSDVPKSVKVDRQMINTMNVSRRTSSRWSEYARDGAPWNADEEEWLFAHFREGTPLPWLSAQLSRTPSAVRARIKQRRNNPLLPPLVPKGTTGVRASVRGAVTTAAAPCASSSRAHEPSPAASSLPGAQATSSAPQPQSADDQRAIAVEQATQRLLKCVCSGGAAESATLLLSRSKLAALAASAEKQLGREATVSDGARHAREATLAAAVTALLPSEATGGDVVRVQTQQLVDVVTGAAKAYFEALASSERAARRRDAKLQDAFEHWSAAFERARAVAQEHAACAPQPPRAPPPLPQQSSGAAQNVLVDLPSLKEAQLRDFIAAAGGAVPEAHTTREALLVAANACMPAWEVQRLRQCESLPEPARFFAALQIGEQEEGGDALRRRARGAARRLSLLTHPDKTTVPGCGVAFVLVQQALQHFTSV